MGMIFAVAEVDTSIVTGDALEEENSVFKYQLTPVDKSCLLTASNQSMFEYGSGDLSRRRDMYNTKDLGDVLGNCKNRTLVFFQTIDSPSIALTGIYYFDPNSNSFTNQFAISPDSVVNTSRRENINFNEFTPIKMNRFTGSDMYIQNNTQSDKTSESNKKALPYDGTTSGGSTNTKENQIQQQTYPSIEKEKDTTTNTN